MGAVKYSGVELYEKTLGILGFGRIGQLVAQRARGFGMRVLAFDAYVAEERFRELGVERAESSDERLRAADFLTLHLPKTPETENWLDADAFAKMKDGVCVLNVARGPLVVDEALKEAIDSGKVAGAALDVFREEPTTDHPLFGYPNVVVTPHLGASTAEATDRAGFQAAEQVVAALTGGVVTSAVNLPAIGPRTGGAGAVPAAVRAASAGSASRWPRAPPSTAGGRVPGPGGRARHPAAHRPGAQGRPARPHRGGRERRERPDPGRGAGHPGGRDQRRTARDFTDLIRVTVVSGEGGTRVVGTVLGRRDRPHLLEAWGHASTCSWSRTWRSSATRPAGDARPGGCGPGRGREWTSSRPRWAAGTTATAGMARRRWSSPPTHRCRGRSSTRSPPRTAS